MRTHECVDIHYQLLEQISTSVDLLGLTNPLKPCAMIALGTPTPTDPHGYLAIGAQASDLVGNALTVHAYISDARLRSLLFPGWESPVSFACCIFYDDPSWSQVVCYSLSGWTAGLMKACEHPEVPVAIELVPFEPQRPSLTRQEIAAQLLAVLVDYSRLGST